MVKTVFLSHERNIAERISKGTKKRFIVFMSVELKD